MGTVVQRLSLEEFEAQYGQNDTTHEYWYGEAIPKGVPTWIHVLLQKILMKLLDEQGFIAASELELRIEKDAHPRPDVVATRAKPRGRYATEALDVVIEIISEDDRASVIRDHCRKYAEWRCGQIYLVYPQERLVVRWENGSEIVTSELAGIPVSRTWAELDAQYAG